MADLPVIGSCSPAGTGQYWGIPECLGRLLQDGDWGPKLEGGTFLRADFPLVALLGTGGGGFWKEREVFTEFTEEDWERNKSRRWKGTGGKRCLPMLLLFSFLLVPPEIIYTTGHPVYKRSGSYLLSELSRLLVFSLSSTFSSLSRLQVVRKAYNNHHLRPPSPRRYLNPVALTPPIQTVGATQAITPYTTDKMNSAGQPIRKRRAHKRSRNGCATCKQRHIRCDELKPVW